MASSTRVHTVHDPSSPETPQQTQSGNGGTNEESGPKLSDLPLPPPQAPPPEASKPLSNEEFLKKNPNPSKEEREAVQKEWDAYQSWMDYKKDKNEVENMRRKHAEEPLFDGQDVLNKDEAARDYMDEMALLLKTDANQEEKRHSYLYLCQLLDDNNYPDLRELCEHNTRRLRDWANGGYKGPRPKMEYYDKAGNVTNTPSQEKDDWNKKKRRTEDAPEENPVTLPPEPYMSTIQGLWQEGTPMLHDILINPEHIRTQSGMELNRINRRINEVKNEFVRSADGKGKEEKEKVEGVPDLSIPVGEVVMMVVGYTERAFLANKTDLEHDPELKKDLEYITSKVNRAGQGDAWIKNMGEAYTHHTQKTAELRASGADSLEKLHAREEFWNGDLLDWIRTNYMASAPSQESPAEWRSAENASQPDSDRMSVDGDGRSQSATQDPNTLDPSSAGQSGTNATASEQSASHTTQSQQRESGNASESSLPTTDDYTVNYGGVDRAIGGYKYCGIKSGGVRGFSVLISMKEDKFYHMVASSDVDADDKGPLDYLEKGGYLVGDLKDPKKSLDRGNSIEGKRCHVEDQMFRDFSMSAYAVGARSPKSSATRLINQYIKGHFNTGKYKGKDFWYSKSSFCDYGGFRKPVVQQMIEKFKNEHGIILDDEVKLEDGNNDSPVHWTKKEAPAPENRARDYFMDGFVVPDDEDGQAPEMKQQMEGFKKTMTEYIDQRIEKQIKELGGGMESRFQTLEAMIAAIGAKLGV